MTLVRNIPLAPQSEEVLLVVQKFSRVRNFYTHPVESSQLSILKVSSLSGLLEGFRAKYIMNGCFLIPHKVRYVAVSLH